MLPILHSHPQLPSRVLRPMFAPMLDWDHLRIVLAIQRGGSMQSAAERLNVDRTTVLRRLDAMEKQLGDRLFVRSSDGCTPTAKGDEVVGAALAIERAMDSLGSRLVQGHDVAAGRVTLTVPDFFASQILAPALPLFVQNYPDIELNVLCGNQHYNIVRGEADIGLRNRWPEQDTVVARKAASVAYGFYASRQYLVHHGTPTGSFKRHHMLLLGEEVSVMLGYDRMMELASEGDIVMRSNAVMPLVQAAAAGAGICFVPAMAIHGYDSLVGVWPGTVGGLRDVFLVAHQDLRFVARIRAVYDFMIELCAVQADVISGTTGARYVAPVATQNPTTLI